MIKLFFLLWLSIFSDPQEPTYKVNKIKVVGNYYVIYVVKDDTTDTTFKIVSKKERMNCDRNIMKNERYAFRISRIEALGGPEVDCIAFDDKTEICAEPGVELALASNLQGLCLIQK